METVELKACAHCGAKGVVIERNNPMSKWKWSVDCASTTCGASGPVESSRGAAITAWNTRFEASLPPSAPVDREALEQAATWFEEYAAEHYAKAKTAPDGREQHGREVKGKTNQDRAAFLRAALALPPSGIAEVVRERCAKVVDAEYNLRIAHYRAAKDAGNKKETRDFETMAIAHSQSASAIRALDLSNMGDGE